MKVEKRDELLAHLISSGIDSMIHYPIPIHRQKSFEAACRDYVPSMPLSDSYCDDILSLPMCPMMTDGMVQRVLTAVHQFYSLASAASLYIYFLFLAGSLWIA